MQTPKARSSPSGTPQKISPRSSEVSQKNSTTPPEAPSSEATQKVSPRVVRQLRTGPRYSDHTASSANLLSKPPKERSPKVVDHRSPKSPVVTEKKRPGRVSELENQICQLEKDLKVVKDQLCSTEEQKKLAQRDAKESNQQLLALSLKLEESQKQASEQTPSDSILLETVQSELEAIRKQHSHDSAALTSALDEIERLKSQLKSVVESKVVSSKNSESELHKLKEDLSETLLLVEDMKNQLSDSKESEGRAHKLVEETLTQLETAKKTVETLRSERFKATEAYNALTSELDQSRTRVVFLEELVSNLEADLSSKDPRSEVDSVKLEVDQLRSALEAAELRYNDERARSKEEMHNALEMVERMKSESGDRVAELETKLTKSKYEVEELKANLMDKETELQGICEENEGLSVKLETTLSGQREIELEKTLGKAKTEIENLRAGLMEKQTEWQIVHEENEKLKSEIKDTSKVFEAGDEIESARNAEREALMKVSYLTEEVEKSNRKVVRASEQLDVAQAAKAEMEAELRRMKVQSDQWRKAAEAAAAMISAGYNNGQQVMERTGSMDSHYSSPKMGKVSSPYGDDLLDDDLMKKKNANMLRRFGVLWKKQQK